MGQPIVYPSTLPSPQVAPIQSTERRMMTPADPGPFDARASQRDRGAMQQASFFFTASEAAIFRDWYTNVLLRGGCWFAAAWPLPQGIRGGVRRFASPPQREFVPGGFWRVTAELEVGGARLPPISAYVDCDLLLHFDAPDASDWLDYSLNKRALTVVPNAGTISGTTTGALFGLGGNFNNPYGGDRQEASYTRHPCLLVNGNISFGGDDFLIEFSLLRRATAYGSASGWCVIDNNVNGGHGFYVDILNEDYDPGLMVFSSYFVSGASDLQVREIRIPGCAADIGTRTRYAFSRQANLMTTFRNGVIVEQQGIFGPGEAMVPPVRGFMRIGASAFYDANQNSPGSPPYPYLIDGLDGVLDELIIGHGPTWGRSANYTPSTEEY